jgi:deoxyribodipyrimidine photolyase-related protein
MLSTSWHLSHTLLSPYLNLGLLSPAEVCDAAEAAYRAGDVPIASAEGFIRQVIGWREYVWGRYWQLMPGYRDLNELDAHEPLPPALEGGPTRMRCVAEAVGGIHERAYAHHIQRLMVLGNLGLLCGVEPLELSDWMRRSFVDGAEWVMLPNVLGMALYADGGVMATKPYAAGGAYIDRMRRVGDDACPFTTLYWDFLDRHRERFGRNPRVARQVRAADRLGDLPEVRERAVRVRSLLQRGEL